MCLRTGQQLHTGEAMTRREDAGLVSHALDTAWGSSLRERWHRRCSGRFVPSPRWINRVPSSPRVLAVVPFALLVAAYLVGSSMRLAANPEDKLMPAPAAMAQAWTGMALREDARTGDYIFWTDTRASLLRLGAGLAIATSLALGFGLVLGMLPVASSLLGPFVTAVSMVPALAVLPILFIVFGLDELSKVVLIVIGVLPFMIRDLAGRIREIPEEQWIKAQTLGASSLQLATRVILPQTMPRLIDSLRLSLGPAWLFLISAEAISATGGLGYRIFLVRRYMAMDVILPYVAWITLLAFMFDVLLRALRRSRYPWVDAEGKT
jgi:NitT/TauT family transport system permease protein